MIIQFLVMLNLLFGMQNCIHKTNILQPCLLLNFLGHNHWDVNCRCWLQPCLPQHITNNRHPWPCVHHHSSLIGIQGSHPSPSMGLVPIVSQALGNGWTYILWEFLKLSHQTFLTGHGFENPQRTNSASPREVHKKADAWYRGTHYPGSKWGENGGYMVNDAYHQPHCP